MTRRFDARALKRCYGHVLYAEGFMA